MQFDDLWQEEVILIFQLTFSLKLKVNFVSNPEYSGLDTTQTQLKHEENTDGIKPS